MHDDPLLNRVHSIFNGDGQEGVDDQSPDDSPFCFEGKIRDLRSHDLREVAAADTLADRWLDTPNANFGRCPRRIFLDDEDEDKRRFLCGVIASIEGGVLPWIQCPCLSNVGIALRLRRWRSRTTHLHQPLSTDSRTARQAIDCFTLPERTHRFVRSSGFSWLHQRPVFSRHSYALVMDHLWLQDCIAVQCNRRFRRSRQSRCCDYNDSRDDGRLGVLPYASPLGQYCDLVESSSGPNAEIRRKPRRITIGWLSCSFRSSPISSCSSTRRLVIP